MKELQKRVNRIYRFRCNRCSSLFEMTEEEKTENDWNFHDGVGVREKGDFPNNYPWKFNCPVCNKVETTSYGSSIDVMDDGTEVTQWTDNRMA